MLVKVFCLTFDSVVGGFRDEIFQEFLKDKEIISIRDHFFIRNEIPYLSLIVQYFPYRSEVQPNAQPQGKRDEAWKELLVEADMGLFNILRDWRSQRCKKDGVPPYVILTNMQLAQIVKSRPQSLADLTKIDGIGSAKTDKFGAEILSITKIKDQNVQT